MPVLRKISVVPDVYGRVFIKEYKYGFDEDGFSNVNKAYRFDEDGFSKANSAAIMAAKQRMQEATLSLWQDLVQINNPVAYSQAVNGSENAPIDFPEFKANAGFI